MSSALGFWLFIAVCVAAAAYSRTQQQRAKLELLRTSIDKGHAFDAALIERLAPTPYGSHGLNGLLTTGIIMAFLGVGLGVFALFLSQIKPQAFWPVTGSGVLCIFIGAAMCVAWKMIARQQPPIPA